MNSANIKKILLIFVLGGLIGGGMIGFLVALLILPFFYNIEEVIFFTIFISLFFIPSILINLWKKKFGLIVRRIFLAVTISLFFTAMFALEIGSIPFDEFDWKIIYTCLVLAIGGLTTFIILSEYFNQSRIYQEIEHIIRGMQLYEILPPDEKNEEEK